MWCLDPTKRPRTQWLQRDYARHSTMRARVVWLRFAAEVGVGGARPGKMLHAELSRHATHVRARCPRPSLRPACSWCAIAWLARPLFRAAKRTKSKLAAKAGIDAAAAGGVGSGPARATAKRRRGTHARLERRTRRHGRHRRATELPTIERVNAHTPPWKPVLAWTPYGPHGDFLAKGVFVSC